MKLAIKEMFLDEAIEVLNLVSNSYDWDKQRHYVRINKGTVGLTDTCKGEKGGQHQVLNNVELEIRSDAPQFISSNVKRLLSKYSIKFEEV